MDRSPHPDDLARATAGEPGEPLHTFATTVGTVKWWKEARGYGAIASEATAPWDIWCHFSAIEMKLASFDADRNQCRTSSS